MLVYALEKYDFDFGLAGKEVLQDILKERNQKFINYLSLLLLIYLYFTAFSLSPILLVSIILTFKKMAQHILENVLWLFINNNFYLDAKGVDGLLIALADFYNKLKFLTFPNANHHDMKRPSEQLEMFTVVALECTKKTYQASN